MKYMSLICTLFFISMSCSRISSDSKSEILNIAHATEKNDSIIFDGWAVLKGEVIFIGNGDDHINMIFLTYFDSYLIIMGDGQFFHQDYMKQVYEHVVHSKENFNFIDNDYPFLTLAYNIFDSIVFSNNPYTSNEIEVLSAHSKDLISLLSKVYSLNKVLNKLQKYVNRDDYRIQIIESSCQNVKDRKMISDLSPGILIHIKSNEIQNIQYRDSYIPDAKQYNIDDQCDWNSILNCT